MALLIGVFLGFFLLAYDGYVVFSMVNVFIVAGVAWVSDRFIGPLFMLAMAGITGSAVWVATRLGGHAEPVDPIDPVSGLHESVLKTLKMAGEEAEARVKANKDVGTLE